jgi:hypothetical protein
MDRDFAARIDQGHGAISAADDLSHRLGRAHISSRVGAIPDRTKRPEIQPIGEGPAPDRGSRSRPLTQLSANIKLISMS